jgi:hypothetical protein
MAPFKLANKQEGQWAKSWLVRQITDGRFPGLRPEAAATLSGLDEIKRFVDRYVVDIDDRQRLQKALSARRSREEAKKSPKYSRKVTTELQREAREILLKVAEQRGITTSDLIRSAFEAEYLKLD